MCKYNITFEKNINDSYMYISGVKINTDSYESILLKNENIDRILKYYLVENDEICKIRFDITGLMSLDSYVKKNALKENDISFIINEISKMLTNAENFLISENSIILNPESIMMTLSRDKNNKIKRKLLFAVIPSYNGDFYEQLVKLLLYILRNVDKNDKKSILLAYNLFSESAKENFTINNLLNIISQDESNNVKQNINNDVGKNEDAYITDNQKAPELSTVNDVAIAYGSPSDLISYNDEIDIDDYTNSILETKYIVNDIEEEQNRKNIEYLKSLELDDINESYDIKTLKAYRDKMVSDSENMNINHSLPKNILNIKNIICTIAGIFLPIFIKTWLGVDALVSNLRYVIGIEILLIAFIALDIIDSIKRRAALVNKI
jgi:hypothetical protein